MYHSSVRETSRIIYFASLDVQCAVYSDHKVLMPSKLAVGARRRTGNFKDPQSSISRSRLSYFLNKLTPNSEASGTIA